MIETGCALILVAICCTIACIVGGNVSLPVGASFGHLSKPTRVILGLFASFSGLVGVLLLIMGLLIPPVGPNTDPPPPPPVSPTPEPEVGWDAYAETTNGKCRKLNEKQSKLEWPDSDAPMSELARAYRQDLRLMDAGLSSLRLTRVPTDQHEMMVGVWNELQVIVEAEEQLVHGLDDEDVDAVATARDQYLGGVETFNRSVRYVGLSDCLFAG